MFRVLLLILVVMSSVAFAQSENSSQQNDVPKAYIFAELGKANNAEVKKKFDGFYKKIKDSDSQGYIVNYGVAKEIANREKQLRNSINFRDDDAPRLTFVRGGNIGRLKTVFWIVPPGAKPPTPISLDKKAKVEKAAI